MARASLLLVYSWGLRHFHDSSLIIILKAARRLRSKTSRWPDPSLYTFMLDILYVDIKFIQLYANIKMYWPGHDVYVRFMFLLAKPTTLSNSLFWLKKWLLRLIKLWILRFSMIRKKPVIIVFCLTSFLTCKPMYVRVSVEVRGELAP